MSQKSKSPDATLGGIRCGGLLYLISFVLVLAVGLTSEADAAPPGLIGWWKLDEMAGTIAYDSSGLENHGRLGGDPKWVAGYFGGALDLDGTDDHVEIDGVANDITDNNFSVSAWIKTTQVGDDDVIIGSNSGGSHDFILGVANGFLFVEANSANTYPPRYQQQPVASHSVRQGRDHRIRIHRWRFGRHGDTLGQSVHGDTVVDRPGMG